MVGYSDGILLVGRWSSVLPFNLDPIIGCFSMVRLLGPIYG